MHERGLNVIVIHKYSPAANLPDAVVRADLEIKKWIEAPEQWRRPKKPHAPTKPNGDPVLAPHGSSSCNTRGGCVMSHVVDPECMVKHSMAKRKVSTLPLAERQTKSAVQSERVKRAKRRAYNQWRRDCYASEQEKLRELKMLDRRRYVQKRALRHKG